MSGAAEVKVRPENRLSRLQDRSEFAVRKGIAPVPAGQRAPLMDVLHPGAVLVRARMIALPKVLRIDGYPFGYWSILRAANALDLEEELRRAGWHFLLMAPPVQTWGFGVDPSRALERALRKAVSAVERENLNALEIKDIRFRCFLGAHLARLSVYARQVQWSREYSYGGCAPVFRPAA